MRWPPCNRMEPSNGNNVSLAVVIVNNPITDGSIQLKQGRTPDGTNKNVEKAGRGGIVFLGTGEMQVQYSGFSVTNYYMREYFVVMIPSYSLQVTDLTHWNVSRLKLERRLPDSICIVRYRKVKYLNRGRGHPRIRTLDFRLPIVLYSVRVPSDQAKSALLFFPPLKRLRS